MKIIKYNFFSGNELCEITIPWSPENEDVAKRESALGQYFVMEDEDENEFRSQEERISELEEALELLLSGVAE